jgi:hypothetical protein
MEELGVDRLPCIPGAVQKEALLGADKGKKWHWSLSRGGPASLSSAYFLSWKKVAGCGERGMAWW